MTEIKIRYIDQCLAMTLFQESIHGLQRQFNELDADHILHYTQF